MSKKVIRIAEQILFASSVFILFLLFFESRLVVPVWLQPLGRMHPLFLHFPIVILLLAMAMELFRFNPAYSSNEFYRGFLRNLLLVGTLTAALTIIMGFFLSREDGYTGQVLQWHKWSGVGLFFLATLMYWARDQVWYKAPIARVSAVLTVLLLVGAGHYGAILTHGENFITGPITNQMQAEPVALDQALVFTDVVRPILEQKCISCHNPDKLKGELSLADAESILKGGKSGKLFVAGKPEMSLLLQRIHLLDSDKKHMPPTGKTQLTTDEVTLLALWVKEKPNFKQKVVDLPATDSLRRLAALRLKPAEATEAYAFDAADEDAVKRLNNDYRTIAPLAKESPALAVNLYNKATYSADKIQELSEIRNQVVYLNLNKLPVQDADLKSVGQFENLQKLDLNFTDVTGKGLAELTALPNLQTLALSGTKVTFADLQKQLGAFKKLRTVSVWNTGLTPAQIQQLQKANASVQIIGGFRDDGSNPIKLNPPQVKNSSTIFDQSLAVQLRHPVKGVQIRYTTDGTDPDSVHSPVFKEGMTLRDGALIKARAYKEGWYGSDVVTFNFYKSSYKPDSVMLLLPLNRVHQADGAHTFFDRKMGTFNANSPAWANNWAGVRKNDMVLVSEFKQPVTLSSVALRTMIEPETGIFPPAEVEVWGGADPKQMKLLGTLKPAMPIKETKPILQAVECRFKPQPVACLKIVAKPVPKLPEWHGSKGGQGLLLVDEIFLN